MKNYPLLIAWSLAIATYTISDDTKAHWQFYEEKKPNNNELNINWKDNIKYHSKK